MNIQIANKVPLDKIKNAVLDNAGRIKVLPAKNWEAFSWDEIRLFMHEYPIYVLPTKELIDSLKVLISPYHKVIEIGAGTGNIGRNLGIQMTDSYLQERPDIKAYYALFGQPTIKYSSDVIRAEAGTAIRVLKPDCVVGCYVTHYSKEGAGNSWGIHFDEILPKVKRLILVGNDTTHGDNPIMKIFHKEITISGLITRAGIGSPNKIYVWGELGNLQF